eukprot:CAMPEP_0119378638 /NCGR_PEP_ID=MMETSP1334-20130426/49159_1 /TAXON_ID=127549 /ORGANISM="Calcidiscus leptoporus, Strain RCC1130" /LENGTH=185 /DNA_ID=CAMNT_0007397907 /DNA_START=432 /DNA_END=990 /DNA_ORIENTATION=+
MQASARRAQTLEADQALAVMPTIALPAVLPTFALRVQLPPLLSSSSLVTNLCVAAAGGSHTTIAVVCTAGCFSVPVAVATAAFADRCCSVYLVYESAASSAVSNMPRWCILPPILTRAWYLLHVRQRRTPRKPPSLFDTSTSPSDAAVALAAAACSAAFDMRGRDRFFAAPVASNCARSCPRCRE